MNRCLAQIFASVSSAVERRLFCEYGAVHVTKATPPPCVMFAGAAEVESYQASLSIHRARIGDHEIALQSEAMEALLAAANELESQGGKITARAADAGARSYQDTVGLWLRNVTRGLEHWQNLDRIPAKHAQDILSLPLVEQVGVILDLEQIEEIYFGTFFDKSILFSVAAPGASQHLSLLAFDVTVYQDEAAERVLGLHGWYRTVPNDLPHFTYLGHKQGALTEQGLMLVPRQYGESTYRFWVPNLSSLE